MVLETVQNLNDLSGNEPLAIWQAARFFLEVYAIEKIKERLTTEKKIKTAAKTIPKQILRRGLDDGTERLRGQFRDASQRGQRSDGYGGDQIEDAAWKGTRWGTRGVELLLKKKKGSSKTEEAEAPSDTDFPEVESPIEAPPSTDSQERIQIKTKDAVPRQAEGPRSTERQPSPSSITGAKTSPQEHSKPPKIKTREAVQQTALSGRTDAVPIDSKAPAVDMPIRTREAESAFRHERGTPPTRRVETPAPRHGTRASPPPGGHTIHTQEHHQPLGIKTKDSYIRRKEPLALNEAEASAQANDLGQRMKRSFFQRKATLPAEKPALASSQGEREFVQEQGRKEAVKQAEFRRSKHKESFRQIGDSGTGKPPITRSVEQFSRQHPAPPSAVGSGSFTSVGKEMERPVGKAIPKGTSRGKNAVKASKAGIKSSRHAARKTVKTAERSAKTAQAARVSAKAPQRVVQAVRATAKAGAATAKGLGKAALSALKRAAAAARELAAAIMAGGWVVAVITLIICIVGLLVTSPFGLFFSDPGSGMTIPEAVAQLNGEFTAQIEQIKTDNPYDTLDFDESGVALVTDNWTNVLAVYSVRVSSGDGTGASILTSENLSVLRETFWDMTEITYATETVEHEDEDDEIILHISVTAKTAQQIANEYGFTEEQKALLEEMLKPEYQDLFQSLIGSNQSITLSPQEVQEILSRLPDDLSEERRQVVLTAYQLLGKVNYFWGGKSLVLGWDARWGTPKEVWAAGSPSTGTIRPYGLDCSGFVDWVFYNVSGGSYIIGHGGGASAQHSYCTAITWVDAQPGDLVFYPGYSHVGIVCGFDSGGDVQIIHCASGSNNVVVTGKIGFTTIARPNYYS